MAQEEEQKYHLDHSAHAEFILDRIQEGVMVLDSDLRVLSVNKYFLDLLGDPDSGVIGGKCHKVFFDQEQPCADCPSTESLKTGKPAGTVRKWDSKGEDTMYLSHQAFPVVDPNGRVDVVIETVRDISELMEYRKKLEEHASNLEGEVVRRTTELKESENKYRTLVERSNDGIVIIQDGLLKFANSKMFEMTGVDSLEDKMESFMDLVSPEYREFVLDRYKKRMAGEEVPDRYEIEILVDDGKRMPVEVSASLIDYDGKHADMAILRDITDRKRAEEALKESEEKYRSLVENVNDGVYIHDLDGVYSFVNPALAEMHGYTPDEMIGKSFLDFVPPEDRDARLTRFKEAAKSRKLVPVIENINMKKDGASVYVQIKPTPVIEEGRVVAVRGIVRDITERKKWEETLHIYAEQLEEAIHAKDLFTDILRHDLMNNLQIITMFLNQLEGEIGSSQEMEEFMGVLKENTSKAIDLVGDATTFAKLEAKGLLDMEQLDVLVLMEHARIEMLQLWGEDGERIHIKGSGDYPIMASLMLTQVFTNLFSNALKYSPVSSEVEVEVKDEGNTYLVVVANRGEGISDENKQDIFERFKRAKRTDGVRGSGLGLAIAGQLVQLHGGRIWVEDNPGGGSIFKVELPKY